MEPKGRTILVTGATDGVGRALAARLAAEGATVLVHGRSTERAESLLREIRAAGGTARFLRADLASLAEVRGLAAAVAADCDRLHVLVSNAGIFTGPRGSGRAESADGIELRFAVNHLAGFLLTRLLLPLLRRAAAEDGEARIVNTSSLAQAPIDFDDPMLTRNWTPMRAYAQSKLAQIISTMDLARELAGSGITVNALHPATLMDTAMVRESGMGVQSSVEDGLAALHRLVTDPALAGRSGLYFNGLQEARADPQAYDRDAQARLRSLSERLCGLQPG